VPKAKENAKTTKARLRRRCPLTPALSRRARGNHEFRPRRRCSLTPALSRREREKGKTRPTNRRIVLWRERAEQV
jgi:hypothetical protein